MKKWQKITGIVLFTIIGLLGALWQMGTYYEIRAWTVTFAAHDCKDALYLCLGSYAFLMWLCYLSALILFICLWRKGGKK